MVNENHSQKNGRIIRATMKDSEIKDSLIGICQTLKIHADQMLELQRRTIALVSILEAPLRERWAYVFDFPQPPNDMAVDALRSAVDGQHAALDAIIQRLKG
jgi:hypothetical protein